MAISDWFAQGANPAPAPPASYSFALRGDSRGPQFKLLRGQQVRESAESPRSKGDAAKGCAWVAAAPYSRCRKRAAGVDAEDACPEVCGACTDCDDDASWYVTRGSKNKRRTCAWVAKKPKSRCKERGDEGERAKNACYATCRCDAL